jgi:hypothetical protein
MNVTKVAAMVPVTEEMLADTCPWRLFHDHLRYELEQRFLDATDGPRYGPQRPPQPKGKPKVVTYWKGRNHYEMEDW